MRGARDYRELVVWQLADELEAVTLNLTRTAAWTRDFDLSREARKTTSQICRNVVEGFRRRGHGEFASFLTYCFASLGELRAIFDTAQKNGYVTAKQLQPARMLCYRFERALRSFIRYLRQHQPPPWWQ